MRFVNYCIPFLFTICTVSQLFGIGFVTKTILQLHLLIFVNVNFTFSNNFKSKVVKFYIYIYKYIFKSKVVSVNNS